MNIGAAMAAAMAHAGLERMNLMTCSAGHEEVRWVGRDLACWCCNGPGEQVYPPKEVT